MEHIGNSWDKILKEEFSSENYLKIMEFVKNEYATRVCYPDMSDIFNALKYTDYRDVKAVIVGQDPYHEKGEAHGLAFSVKRGVKIPPSLKNIYKELESDLGLKPPSHGFLESWAKEGALLLNATLTVREHEADSHKNCGWQTFTDDIIKALNKREKAMVFILWGANARAKKQYIDAGRHLVIESAHPSPFSARKGFFGSKPFSRTNAFLKSVGESAINWEIAE